MASCPSRYTLALIALAVPHFYHEAKVAHLHAVSQYDRNHLDFYTFATHPVGCSRCYVFVMSVHLCMHEYVHAWIEAFSDWLVVNV